MCVEHELKVSRGKAKSMPFVRNRSLSVRNRSPTELKFGLLITVEFLPYTDNVAVQSDSLRNEYHLFQVHVH